MSILHEIIKRTYRVPIIPAASLAGNGITVARQIDAALMQVGFKLSADLFDQMASHHPTVVSALGSDLILAAKELVGDTVAHNVYFIDFPRNVPDTEAFWLREILRLFFTGDTAYGTYQHTYAEMIARHDELITQSKDRLTIFHRGATLAEEAHALYIQLATSTVPLNDADRVLVRELAEVCDGDAQPSSIPMRETRAVINAVRIQHAHSITIDTITDILRLAAALSDGDVALQTPTKFRSFSHPVRRIMLAALDATVAQSPDQLLDVPRYAEYWKRLGERLHPHAYPHLTQVREVFAVARGEQHVTTLEAKVALAFGQRDIVAACRLLAYKPGLLVRSMDHLLRLAHTDMDHAAITASLVAAMPKVAGRVVLALREHLMNRAAATPQRIFVNQHARAWGTPDTRALLPDGTTAPLIALIDQEVMRRLPATSGVTIDPEMARIAVPLSNKGTVAGHGGMPRGSITPIAAGVLRFFIYWHQTAERTDLDLSVLVLDDDFTMTAQVSWTNLKTLGGVHSGDLTQAPNGATEMIDLDLSAVSGRYLVPQINIYAGEQFTQLRECYFGMMHRTTVADGKPFEPSTVRIKTDIRGTGKVALPLIFMRQADGTWGAKWLNLYLKGSPNMNRLEANKVSTALLVRGIVERQFLTITDLAQMMPHDPAAPAMYIGMQRPDGIPSDADIRILTLTNLSDVIPA